MADRNIEARRVPVVASPQPENPDAISRRGLFGLGVATGAGLLAGVEMAVPVIGTAVDGILRFVLSEDDDRGYRSLAEVLNNHGEVDVIPVSTLKVTKGTTLPLRDAPARDPKSSIDTKAKTGTQVGTLSEGSYTLFGAFPVKGKLVDPQQENSDEWIGVIINGALRFFPKNPVESRSEYSGFSLENNGETVKTHVFGKGMDGKTVVGVDGMALGAIVKH